MKKVYIILILAVLTASSCEDFLNTKPTMKISQEQFYNDEGGLNRALTGVYDVLGSLYSRNLSRHMDPSDELYLRYSKLTNTGLIVNNFDRNDSELRDTWTNLYTGINRANDLITNINIAEMDEASRQVILGEALFLRGYYYFILVTRWGDVPLRLTPTTTPLGLSVPRTPTVQVYEQIIKDMKAAEEKVAPNKYSHSGRISKTVVQGILARVYLHMAGNPLKDTSKYAEALAYAKKVIDSGERGLKVDFNSDPLYDNFNPSVATNTSNNAYRQIFINMAAKLEHDTRESLWEVEFKGDGSDGGYNERGAIGVVVGGVLNLLNPGYCYGYTINTLRLYNMYASGKDLRRDWNIATYTLKNVSGKATRTAKPAFTTDNLKVGNDIGKYRREYELPSSTTKNDSSLNFPLLRYADILLMYAEAENMVNGPTAAAYDAVNQVRRRAYGLPIGTPSTDPEVEVPAGLSQANFQLFIENERMRELCLEGMRRMDLIRWGKYVPVMKLVLTEFTTKFPSKLERGVYVNTQDKHVLYPIPALEMATNPLITENNPGW